MRLFTAGPGSLPGLPSSPSVRPPLPPYHVVMQNAQGTTPVTVYMCVPSSVVIMVISLREGLLAGCVKQSIDD